MGMVGFQKDPGWLTWATSALSPFFPKYLRSDSNEDESSGAFAGVG